MHLNNLGPSFCFIAPVEYLEYATASTSHLVLAHMVAEDPDYAEFYAERKRQGDFIIMDNSAFELGESFDPEQLIELGNACNADVIVLPDYPLVHVNKTIEAAEKYIPMFKNAGFKCMFVPQSEAGQIDQWIEGYKYAANNPDISVIGMSILGIPNALKHIHPGYARVVMSQILLEHGLACNKHHHYLGLTSGPALEIPSLLQMGMLDTIDSSGPIWAGITGHRYCPLTDSFMHTSKVHMPVNFHMEWVTKKEIHDTIKHNIDMTKSLFV